MKKSCKCEQVMKKISCTEKIFESVVFFLCGEVSQALHIWSFQNHDTVFPSETGILRALTVCKQKETEMEQ